MENNYILLADPNPELLGLKATALKHFYGGKIVLVNDSATVISYLNNLGRPEILFADVELLQDEDWALMNHIEASESVYPVIAVAGGPRVHAFARKHSSVSGALEKPIKVDTFTYLVKGLISGPEITPAYIPIDIKTVLDLACNNYDLYLKLSEFNFVKIISKDDVFSYIDAQKLLSKGVHEVYVQRTDLPNLLSAWEKSLRLDFGDEQPILEQSMLAIGVLENIEKVSRAFAFNSEILTSTQNAINSAVKVLSQDLKIMNVLKKKMAQQGSTFAKHVGLTCYLNCAFSAQMGWAGQMGQTKLVLAVLLHDLFVDEDHYKDVSYWNKRASNEKDKSPETVKYRLHPVLAAKLAQNLNQLPPDVDQIILQHHERMGGVGFPRALDYKHIHHLAAIFIMAEDAVELIIRSDVEAGVKTWLLTGESDYSSGIFKKIFSSVKVKIA